VARKNNSTIRLVFRARELVPGGFLWMYIPGPGAPKELPRAGYEGNTWIDIIDDAWRDLVKEGLLEHESLDNFNMPGEMK
jgi:hypothetical protein